MGKREEGLGKEGRREGDAYGEAHSAGGLIIFLYMHYVLPTL